ncbi:MAG: hypothetical protein RSD28_05830 [Lachnospiraceae bacterium]
MKAIKTILFDVDGTLLDFDMYEIAAFQYACNTHDILFSDAFISEEIGYQKPRKEYFEKCFQKIEDFQKTQTMIVGDIIKAQEGRLYDRYCNI